MSVAPGTLARTSAASHAFVLSTTRSFPTILMRTAYRYPETVSLILPVRKLFTAKVAPGKPVRALVH
jgi:hypothetical protein